MRTERLLARPFALRRPGRTGDALQSREGYLLFRVNGGRAVGRYFRLLAAAANMAFGALAGLSPLIPPGSPEGFAQALSVMALQFGMAFLCCRCLPDADRLISRFAGLQFGLEGLATAANVMGYLQTLALVGEIGGDGGGGGGGGEGADGSAAARRATRCASGGLCSPCAPCACRWFNSSSSAS